MWCFGDLGQLYNEERRERENTLEDANLILSVSFRLEWKNPRDVQEQRFLDQARIHQLINVLTTRIKVSPKYRKKKNYAGKYVRRAFWNTVNDNQLNSLS